MIQKRINLCFDVEDEKQKEVYEYLTRSGRRKTAVVTSALTQTLMSDTYWRNMQVDRDAELCERFASIVRDNNSSKELEDVKKALGNILEKLDNVSVVKGTDNSEPKTNDNTNANESNPVRINEPEMSEDAFDAMMAFMG